MYLSISHDVWRYPSGESPYPMVTMLWGGQRSIHQSADIAVIAVFGMRPKKTFPVYHRHLYDVRCLFHSLTESGVTALEVAEIFGSRHAVVSERGLCGSVLPPLAAIEILFV